MLQYCSVKPKIWIFNHVKIAAKKHDLPLMRWKNVKNINKKDVN